MNKVMLWVATVVVLAFAFFPNYIGVILAGGNSPVQMVSEGLAESSSTFTTVQIDIEGMTCAACATGLAAHLNGLPGVRRAVVDYDSKSAKIVLSENTRVDFVLKAITEYGYRGKVKQ